MHQWVASSFQVEIIQTSNKNDTEITQKSTKNTVPERVGAVLGASWGRLGRHGAVLGRLGAFLGRLGAFWGPSWRPSWGRLGASWGVLGPSWSRLGAVLGRLGVVLGHLKIDVKIDQKNEASWNLILRGF